MFSRFLFGEIFYFSGEQEKVECVQQLQEVASSSSSELVYGYDDNGNQVAVALIVDGQYFNSNDVSNVELLMCLLKNRYQ